METVEMVIKLISDVGFPIFACLGMGYMYYKNREDTQLTVEKLSIIVEQNTKILEQLIEEVRRK